MLGFKEAMENEGDICNCKLSKSILTLIGIKKVYISCVVAKLSYMEHLVGTATCSSYLANVEFISNS